MAPTLANLALKFGPPENFTLMLMGMMVVTYLARKSMLKALVMTGSVFSSAVSGWTP